MKLSILTVLSFYFIINIVNAQSITVFSNTGTLVKDANKVSQGIKIKNVDPKNYIFAFKKGYITKGVTIGTIFKNKSLKYKINIVPIVTLSNEYTSKIIGFAKFVDRTGKIPVSDSYGYWGYTTGIDMGDTEFVGAITNVISDLGYITVGGNSDIFKEKQKTPGLVIAGEILHLAKETKKTPGYMISVAVNWSVYNVEKEKVVYELTTGGYSDSQIAHKFKDELILGLKDAALGLLADDGFVKLANKEEIVSDEENFSDEFLVLSKVPKSSLTDNAEIIKNSINSVVTVKTEFGHGSGFLISENGYAITNSHVVADTDKIEVIFNNNITLPAEIITNDKIRDVTLLKIVGGGYSPLPVNTGGNTTNIGSEVIAIGTPKNVELGQSVSKGILSGYRNIENKSYIQTDVSINMGNSGGPLLNSAGEVIGIVVAKMIGNDIEGLGFAIPIDEAVKGLKIKFEEE